MASHDSQQQPHGHPLHTCTLLLLCAAIGYIIYLHTAREEKAAPPPAGLSREEASRIARETAQDLIKAEVQPLAQELADHIAMDSAEPPALTIA